MATTWTEHALFVTRALNGDYGVWGGLQALTIHHSGVVIVGIHHQRKGAAEDVLDTVLGSQSVTGVADTILVLKKSRGQTDGELYVTGRDVNERERGLKFDNGTWTDVGDAVDIACRRNGTSCSTYWRQRAR